MHQGSDGDAVCCRALLKGSSGRFRGREDIFSAGPSIQNRWERRRGKKGKRGRDGRKSLREGDMRGKGGEERRQIRKGRSEDRMVREGDTGNEGGRKG